jgi:zinc transporter
LTASDYSTGDKGMRANVGGARSKSLREEDTTYGSDRNGLIWGYIFAPGKPAEPIDSAAAAEVLSAPSGDEIDSFLWLHFSLSNAASQQWLNQNLSPPEAFLSSLQESGGSTRVEQEGDSLVAVIHDVVFDSKLDTSDVSTVSLWVKPRVLVSARLRPLRSIDRLRNAVKAGEKFRSSAGLLTHLLADQANVLVEIVRNSTAMVDRIEDNVLGLRISVRRSELGTVRRVLVRLQRLLAPEPAALFRLLSRPPAWIDEDDLQELRQSAEEFSAAVADCHALVERVRLIQEELAALINEQNNRSLYVLAVVTVLALPFNVIAGLFGMNVGGIPFANHGWGFWLILGLVATLTSFVAYLAFARRQD